MDNDCVFHSEVYGILHRILLEDFAGPFRFLDLACGDARGIVGALQGTSVAHYHGVDLSRPALNLASEAVEALPCQSELDQRDFVAAMAERPEPADMVWIGLSLHHLQTSDKLVIMEEVRGAVGDRGEFMLYEPTCRDGESRDEYLARFAAICRPLWTALTPEEWDCINDHVTQCDFPETPVQLAGTRLGGGLQARRAAFRGADRSLRPVPLPFLAPASARHPGRLGSPFPGC